MSNSYIKYISSLSASAECKAQLSVKLNAAGVSAKPIRISGVHVRAGNAAAIKITAIAAVLAAALCAVIIPLALYMKPARLPGAGGAQQAEARIFTIGDEVTDVNGNVFRIDTATVCDSFLYDGGEAFPSEGSLFIVLEGFADFTPNSGFVFDSRSVYLYYSSHTDVPLFKEELFEYESETVCGDIALVFEINEAEYSLYSQTDGEFTLTLEGFAVEGRTTAVALMLYEIPYNKIKTAGALS